MVVVTIGVVLVTICVVVVTIGVVVLELDKQYYLLVYAVYCNNIEIIFSLQKKYKIRFHLKYT